MITNISVTKIDSKAYPSEVSAKFTISHNLNIKSPNIISQLTPFGSKDLLRTDYLFSINYLNPNMGYIIIEGTIDYYTEGNLLEIRDNWQTHKTDNIKNEISNMFLLDIAPFAMLISQKLKLPPILPLPIINFANPNKKPENPSYIG